MSNSPSLAPAANKVRQEAATTATQKTKASPPDVAWGGHDPIHTGYGRLLRYEGCRRSV